MRYYHLTFANGSRRNVNVNVTCFNFELWLPANADDGELYPSFDVKSRRAQLQRYIRLGLKMKGQIDEWAIVKKDNTELAAAGVWTRNSGYGDRIEATPPGGRGV